MAEAAEGDESCGRQPQSYDVVGVLDFEATCDDRRAPKPQEIIEFPVALLDTATLRVRAEYSTFVKPRKHRILTPFCTQLTSITQEEVDGGIDLQEALAGYRRFHDEHVAPTERFIFVTCGEWDLVKCLPLNCHAYGLGVPRLFHRWVNIKTEFALRYDRLVMVPQGRGRGRGQRPHLLGMAGMLERLGLPLEGRHHRGMDDVRNITKIVQRLIQDGHVLQPSSACGA